MEAESQEFLPPTTGSSSERSDTPRLVGLAATILIVGLGGFAALGLAFAEKLGHQGSKPTVKTARATGAAEAESKAAIPTGTALAGAMEDESEDYVPTSEYVEKGADSDVTVMAFDKKGANAPDGAGLPQPESRSGAGLDDYDVQKVMLAHQNDMIQCYADGLQQDPDMAGRVDFHFRIASDGHVAMVKLTGSGLRDRTTEDCLVDRARRWKFPSTNRPGLAKFDTNFDFYAE